MEKYQWEIKFGGALILLAGVFNLVLYLVYRDANHILLWTLTNFAFLPISVLFVTLIIDRLLTRRQKELKLEKLNMLIGPFFSEIGMRLLIAFTKADPSLNELQKHFLVDKSWSEKEFTTAKKRLRYHDCEIAIRELDIAHLRSFLLEKRHFLFRMLENQSLLENETFTELLRTIFHLADELEHRKDISSLPDTDRDHLAGDMKRAYRPLLHEWLVHMRYMKNRYPYLFSLAIRINPFDLNASPIVK